MALFFIFQHNFWREESHKLKFLIINFVFFVLILYLPFNQIIQKNISLEIDTKIYYAFVTYSAFFILNYSVFCILNYSARKISFGQRIFHLLLFGMILNFDYVVIGVVYIEYQEIDFIWLIICLTSLLFVKLSILPTTRISYKIAFFCSLIFMIVEIAFISKIFVPMTGLGNYLDDFTIKTEYIKKSILNLPNCFKDYNLTCIDAQNSDENKTTINNLLMRVKSDDRYHFRAFASKESDFDLTKFGLTKGDFGLDTNASIEALALKAQEVFKIPSCDHDKTDKACYDISKDSVNIKNYHKKFQDFTKENGNVFKDFRINKANIID